MHISSRASGHLSAPSGVPLRMTSTQVALKGKSMVFSTLFSRISTMHIKLLVFDKLNITISLYGWRNLADTSKRSVSRVTLVMAIVSSSNIFPNSKTPCNRFTHLLLQLQTSKLAPLMFQMNLAKCNKKREKLVYAPLKFCCFVYLKDGCRCWKSRRCCVLLVTQKQLKTAQKKLDFLDELGRSD